MPQRLRIFISSPTDVSDERLRADLIVDKLSQDYSRFFAIESYRWEHEAMIASKHFQDVIEPPSAFDIVVLILWSRLGTTLPEKTVTREYRGIDGRAPVTGTEWEYEEALKAARERGAPDLLAFRNVNVAPVETVDSQARAMRIAQLDALDAFWTRHFADRGVYLAAYDKYRTLEEFSQRLEQSLRKLIERRIKTLAGTAESQAPVWLGDPFRGLESYEFEHAPIFFGRDAAVVKATERLAANARCGHAFLLVSGSSGSGKSSLAKAGIVPRLMKRQRISGAAFLRRCVFRPAVDGTDVFSGLATALTHAAAPDIGLPELLAPGQDAVQLATHLRGAAVEPGFPFSSALGQLTQSERKSGRLLAFEEAKLILVVDQFEELFTVSGITSEDRRLFVRLLAGLARSRAVWIIATLRADFWHRAAEIPELTVLAEGQGRIDLAAASSAELAEMIRKPAQAAGLSFEVHAQTGLGLDVVLAQDAAAAPGALPLLSFTLDELHKNAKRRDEVVLTHASYEALGGLEGAIANRADEIVRKLPAAGQVALPRVLRALTTVTGAFDRAPVARSVALETFAEGSPARILVDAFVAARLLVAGGESGAASTVRLAHEALIVRWKRARDQLAADRRDLETRTLVEREFERWSRARGYARWLLLLRNPDLANAIDLARRWGDELHVSTRDFIKQSARRQHFLTGSLAAGLVLALGLAGTAYWQRGIAVEQRRIAQQSEAQANEERDRANSNFMLAQQNEAQAKQEQGKTKLAGAKLLSSLANERVRSGDSGTGILLAHEAFLSLTNIGTEVDKAETERSLFGAIQNKRETLILPHSSGLNYVEFSPDGKQIASINGETGHLWNSSTGQKIADLVGDKERDNSQEKDLPGYTSKRIKYSPDSKFLLTFGIERGSIFVWSTQDGSLMRKIQTQEVRDAVFTPDSSSIVVATEGGTLESWDLLGRSLSRMSFGGGLSGLVFSPDGKRVAVGASTGAVIWELNSQGQYVGIRGCKNFPGAFSPDGKFVVALEACSGSKTAIIWDAVTGRPVLTLEGHEGNVWAATYSPDGKLVVTGARDSTARIWDAGSGRTVAILRHSGPVNMVSFDSSGKYVLTASEDQTARIWDGQNGAELARLAGHLGEILSARFNNDRSRVVTASTDQTARIWQTEPFGSPRVVQQGWTDDSDRYKRGDIDIKRATISPSGSVIAAADGAGRVIILDASSGGQQGVLTHSSEVKDLVFDSDGLRLLTAAGNTAQLWDIGSGKTLSTFVGRSKFDHVRLNRDGTRVVTTSYDNTLRTWEARSGLSLQALADANVEDVIFGYDGKSVIGWKNKSIYRWLEGASALEEFSVPDKLGENTFIMAVTATAPGRVSALFSDGVIRTWDSISGGYVKSAPLNLNKSRDYLYGKAASFTKDGQRLVLNVRGQIKIFDTNTGAELGRLYGIKEYVRSIDAPTEDGLVLLVDRDPQGKGTNTWQLVLVSFFSVPAAMDTYVRSSSPRCLTLDQYSRYLNVDTPPSWCATKWPYLSASESHR
jgi:WD40 repeat protein